MKFFISLLAEKLLHFLQFLAGFLSSKLNSKLNIFNVKK